MSAGYRDGLLAKAVDLADRLMPAFKTPSGIPLSWVNLRRVRPLSLSPATHCDVGMVSSFNVRQTCHGDAVHFNCARG